MPNLEYDIPMEIETPEGNILLNVADADTGEIYIVRYEDYSIIPALRVTQDNISQADGSVLHTRWKTGLVAQLKVSYYVTESGTDANPSQVHPACGAQLREMHEALVLQLNSIRNEKDTAGRYLWTPTGLDAQRLIDEVLLLSWLAPTYDLSGIEASVEFSLESPFPYAIDITRIDVPVLDNEDNETITNAGNAAVFPVFKLHGPVTSWTQINNVTTGFQIVYNPTLPGGANILTGHYAEIDTFRGTVYLDSDGDNLIANIDPAVSDFFALEVGANEISLANIGDSPTLDVLVNNGWA